jgi:uncharacterized protein (DUF362 family)
MSRHCKRSKNHSKVSRRDFLQLAGLGAASLFMQSCQSKVPAVSPIVESPSKDAARVAVGRATTYDRETVQNQVRELIESLGGLSDVVTPGDAVAIKPNLTGGVESGSLPRVDPVDSFVTHPEVTRALVKEVKAAGASEIFILEAVYEWESYRHWGYEEIAEDTDAILIDLNDFKPYKDFREDSVGEGSFIYDKFIFNPIINDIDVFMSISKMKNHFLAGVTHTMKNLYGLVPYRFYRLVEGHEYRSEFHGEGDATRSRLPQVILDLNRARPIDFSLIDGIKSTQGGEGPWIETMSAIQPGLLVAGKNSVSTDAVATALMGHDPTGEYPNDPYVRCDNHLNIAASLGLGTNQLDEIEVVGESIETAKINFNPGW